MSQLILFSQTTPNRCERCQTVLQLSLPRLYSPNSPIGERKDSLLERCLLHGATRELDKFLLCLNARIQPKNCHATLLEGTKGWYSGDETALGRLARFQPTRELSDDANSAQRVCFLIPIWGCLGQELSLGVLCVQRYSNMVRSERIPSLTTSIGHRRNSYESLLARLLL